MDLRDFGTTLARWWYLALATLLLAIAAGVGLYKAVGPSYTANSSVLLLPPKAVLLEAQQDKRNYAPNNPLLYLASLSDARDVLVRHLSSTDVTKQLEAKAAGATVTVEGDATSGSPLILVESEGATEAEAVAGMKAIDAMVPGTLKTLQDEMKIADLQRITSINVTEDTEPEVDHKNQLLAAAVGFAGVSALGLAAIALLDQRRTRRQRAGATAVPARSAEPANAKVKPATSKAGTRA
ncbi:hypothetical protein AAEX63_11440 [Luteococcus sp. H138]|uniref:hypothetical protein n=1 Tax=unclassified Luteococcus TaxID=2639923 RepID=UPI00313AC43D